MATPIPSSGTRQKQSLFGAILTTGLLVGTLDIVTAMIVYNVGPAQIFPFITSGAFGNEAFSGSFIMIFWGIVFHYFIAFAWTVVFFLMVPKVAILRKRAVLNGLLYGIVIWLVMNMIILPLSRLSQAPLNFKAAVIGAAILMVMVGLPIAMLAQRYYRGKR
ncbi:MAG TPA: DUF1440 domain-containing protein [Ohtaekwangia sp.]|nr:DUF1440 domain-containing protein [Ohtaekwangia sp.]